MTDITFDEPIKVQLNHGSSKSFRTAQKIQKFFEKEQEAWAWLDGGDLPPSRGREVQTLRSQVTRAIESLAGSLSSIIETNGPEYDYASILNNYTTNKIICSDSPEGQHVLKIANKNKARAIVVLWGFILDVEQDFNHGRVNRDTPIHIQALTEKTIFHANVKAYGNAFEESMAKRMDELAEYERGIQRDKNKLLKAIKAQSTRAENTDEKIQSDFTQLKENITEQFKKIEEYYGKKVELSAPVSYWKTVSSVSKGKAKLWGGVFVAAAAAFVVALVCTVRYFVGNYGDKMLDSGEVIHVEPPLYILGFAGVGILFAIWLLRILLKIHLSHSHLASDAAARRTMVQTFLALSSRNEKTTDAAMQAMLENIFRPTNDGFIKDDSHPLLHLEAVSKFAKPR